MKYLKAFSIFIISFALLITLIFIVVETQTNKALKDYSMLPKGVEVVAKVILGRRERTLSKGLRQGYIRESRTNNKGIFRRGAISLICTNQNNVLLLVQAYRPTRHGKAGGIGEGLFQGSNFSASKRGETQISNMTYLYRGYFDVYVSDPLSQQEITSIIEILKIEVITQVKIIAFDGGNVFTADYNLSEVEQLIDNCQP